MASSTAQETIQEKGVGVYFHLKPRVVNSQVGAEATVPGAVRVSTAQIGEQAISA